MRTTGPDLLRRLESILGSYGGDAARGKMALLEGLERRRLTSPAEVARLHEALCFLRAYPDDVRVLSRVERMLAAFASRGDLRRDRSALFNSGIAGTRTYFRFYWPTARWLAGRWPHLLTLDWAEFDHRDRLVDVLPSLLPYSETPALDETDHSPREWLDLLKGPEETDAAFLVRRFDALPTDSFNKERLYDALDVPLRLESGEDTPARGNERYAPSRVVYQDRPLDRRRPDLRVDVRIPPRRVRVVPPREGRRLIDLARGAMVTRTRDLDAFANADPNDVRLIDCGRGLEFACFGAVPERRLMLESSYGFLTIKNGVPIGYVLASALFGSAAIAYNVFDTFRGGESAWMYGRVLAMTRHLFGVDSFSVDPFQLGHGNEEGLASGAWWFYYKMGFRPVDPDVKRVLRDELSRMKKDPSHRSSRVTLSKLVMDDVYFHLDDPRDDVLGRISLGDVGLAISRYLAGRFGADREGGIRACATEAARLLGVRSRRGWSRAEKLMWERWSPLVLALPGVEGWSPRERRAAVRVIRAKGGRHESDFVRRFDAHRKLRRAVAGLARSSRA